MKEIQKIENFSGMNITKLLQITQNAFINQEREEKREHQTVFFAKSHQTVFFAPLSEKTLPEGLQSGQQWY